MTSQTFKTRVLTIAIIMMTSLSIQAQETDRNGQSTMQALIGQSLEAEQAISQMEKMKGADPSDICTLRGFLLMVRIVQDPAKNGQRYYLDVMDNYEKALKLNPDNQLAKQLQEKFFEGMKGGN